MKETYNNRWEADSDMLEAENFEVAPLKNDIFRKANYIWTSTTDVRKRAHVRARVQWLQTRRRPQPFDGQQSVCAQNNYFN